MSGLTLRTTMWRLAMVAAGASAASWTLPAIAQPCDDWQRIAQFGPPPRFQHAMAYDTIRGVTVMFGGYDGGRFGDTWEWNGADWTLVATSGPSPRMNHAMAFDSARGKTVLFGGFIGPPQHMSGETWEWDGSTWTRVSEVGPPPRDGHAMVYDTRRGVTIMYGGETGFGLAADTWEWDGVQWRQVADQNPLARRRPAMVYDADRGVAVLFGGDRTNFRMRDTWEWDGAQWTRVENGTPPARAAAAMAYDSTWRRTVLHGGVDSSGYEDLWLWDGSTWTQVLGLLIPSRRSDHAAVYDSARRTTVIFGGNGAQRFSDTWEWASRWWIQEHPADEIELPGATAEFRVRTEGIPGVTFQWRRDEQNLTNDGRISGAQTNTLQIMDVGLADLGNYDCVVSDGPCRRTSQSAALFVVNPRLDATASCPGGGPVDVTWQRATPGAEVALLYARTEGSLTIPNGQPCAGTTLGLGLRALQVAWRGNSGNDGSRSIHGATGPGACGGFFQLLDLSSCTTSNTQRLE